MTHPCLEPASRRTFAFGDGVQIRESASGVPRVSPERILAGSAPLASTGQAVAARAALLAVALNGLDTSRVIHVSTAYTTAPGGRSGR